MSKSSKTESSELPVKEEKIENKIMSRKAFDRDDRDWKLVAP